MKQVAQWRRTARRLVIQRQKKSEAVVNRRRGPNPIFNRGELALVARKRKASLSKSKKFLPRFIGPYQISRRVSPTCYEVEDIPFNRSRRIFRRFNVHSSQIRRYKARRDIDWNQDDDTDSDSPEEDASFSENVDEIVIPPKPPEDPLAAGDATDNSPQREDIITRSGRRLKPRHNDQFIYY